MIVHSSPLGRWLIDDDDGCECTGHDNFCIDFVSVLASTGSDQEVRTHEQKQIRWRHTGSQCERRKTPKTGCLFD